MTFEKRGQGHGFSSDIGRTVGSTVQGLRFSAVKAWRLKKGYRVTFFRRTSGEQLELRFRVFDSVWLIRAFGQGGSGSRIWCAHQANSRKERSRVTESILGIQGVNCA